MQHLPREVPTPTCGAVEKLTGRDLSKGKLRRASKAATGQTMYRGLL
jgi:hypothetical protein